MDDMIFEFDDDFEDDYQLYCREFRGGTSLEEVRKIFAKVPKGLIDRIIREMRRR